MMKNVPPFTGKHHSELIVIALLGFLVLVLSLPMIGAIAEPRIGEDLGAQLITKPQ